MVRAPARAGVVVTVSPRKVNKIYKLRCEKRLPAWPGVAAETTKYNNIT
jgi:hypothetical protein